MLDGDNLFSVLFNFWYDLVDICNDIWDFLNTEIDIDFSIVGIQAEFTPLEATGTVVIALIIAKLIKDFIPLA